MILFEERVKEFNVPTLNERSNSPVEYCQLYRERYMPRAEKSVAIGAKVTYLIPPTGKYAEIGKTALVDGLFGGSTFVESWIGWEGTDGAFVIDLVRYISRKGLHKNLSVQGIMIREVQNVI